jgi:hypothetical protein
MDIRAAFDKDAHRIYVRVQSGTHERSVTRFIAGVGIRSLLEQVLHLHFVAVADGVKESLVEGALVGAISRHGGGIRTGWSQCSECPNAD